MQLCKVCSNIDIRTLLAAAQERHKTIPPYTYNEPLTDTITPYKHHSNIFKVRDNAKHCEFCALIWEGEAWRKEDSKGNEEVSIYVLGHRYEYDEMKGSQQFWLHIQVGGVRSRNSWDGYNLFRCGVEGEVHST